PFVQDGRIFAHNGVLEGLPELDARLGAGGRRLVSGDTDSERLFALVTQNIAATGGDIEAGLLAAVEWVADSLPLFSLNLLLATRDELWALRYPDTNELWLLDRGSGGTHGGKNLDHASLSGQIRVRS
nr:class II glutamine amidotransferase [Micromonospora sp. DSM 115978]